MAEAEAGFASTDTPSAAARSRSSGPSSALITTAASPGASSRMAAISHGYQLGKKTGPLFGLDFRANFERPLADLRRELNLPVDAPKAVAQALAA